MANYVLKNQTCTEMAFSNISTREQKMIVIIPDLPGLLSKITADGNTHSQVKGLLKTKEIPYQVRHSCAYNLWGKSIFNILLITCHGTMAVISRCSHSGYRNGNVKDMVNGTSEHAQEQTYLHPKV